MQLEISSINPNVNLAEGDYLVSAEQNPADVSELLLAGIREAQAGNRSEARYLLLRVTELEPNNEKAWLWLASISEYPEELLVFLKNVLNINPNNAQALEWSKATRALLAKTFVQRGVGAAKEDRRDFARQCFLQAISHDLENELAWLWLASISEQAEEKTSYLQKVLEINPENSAARMSLNSLSSRKNASPTIERSEENNHQTLAPIVEPAQNGVSAPTFYQPEALGSPSAADNLPTQDHSEEIGAMKTAAFTWKEEKPATTAQPVAAESSDCPFCGEANESQIAFCRGCRAMLTLSDLEKLLAHKEADEEILQMAIERMESEEIHRNFAASEFVNLGIAHINLKNSRKGLSYLQKAVRLEPNNLLLEAQVRSLAIRLAEIEERDSIHSSQPRGRMIMVVDDSATVRKLITSKLEKSGHDVICAEDGMEALAKLNEIVPDLILLDINMPKMDGYQVCKLIRGNAAIKDVPVVMISGKDGFFDKVRGRMAGSTGYITKPFGPETLMKMVETYIVQPVEEISE